MRVLHIGTDGEWRGGENQIYKLCTELRARQVESFIAYPATSRALPRFAAGFSTLGLAEGGREAVQQISEYAGKNRIQIIDAHSSKAHKLALAAVKKSKTPVHFVVHRRVRDFPKFNPFRRQKYFDPAVNKIVAVSKAVENILLENGISKDKISVIRDGIDLKDFQPASRVGIRARWRKDLGLTDETLAVGIVAALTREKGHDDFLRALTYLPAQLKLKAFIAGRGSREGELKKLCSQLDLSKRVKFLGFIEDTPGLLNALDIAVLPSRSEAMGSVLIEATAAGCAVIGSNNGGIPEFVHDGETGALFETGDSRDLARVIEDLAGSAVKRARLHESALRLADEKFSVKKMGEETYALYRQLLD